MIKNTTYQIQIHKYRSFFVAAGSPGNAVARVQPGGGGEAAEDDGGQPSYSQVFGHDDVDGGDIYHDCVCVCPEKLSFPTSELSARGAK